MTTEWAHLPNAVHIDRVIASARVHLDHWARAWATPAWDAPKTVAWKATRSTVRDDGDTVQAAAWNALLAQVRSAQWRDAREVLTDQVRLAQYAAREVLTDQVRLAQYAAWDALLALIAFDDCAYMLDSEPDELAVLAAFGNTKAVLLLPACKVFHSLKTNA